MAHAQALPDPPPRSCCEQCVDGMYCSMRGEVTKGLLFAWLSGESIKECAFYQPDNYHGLEGVRA